MLTGFMYCVCCGVRHLKNVVSVTVNSGDAVSPGNFVNGSVRLALLQTCKDGVLIILAHENNWERVQRCEIQRLMDYAFLEAPVSEIYYRNAVLAFEFSGPRRADGYWNRSSNNSGGAHESCFCINKVH